MAWTAQPTCISGPTALLPLARRRGGLPTARPYLAACTSNTSPLAPLRPPSSPTPPPPHPSRLSSAPMSLAPPNPVAPARRLPPPARRLHREAVATGQALLVQMAQHRGSAHQQGRVARARGEAAPGARQRERVVRRTRRLFTTTSTRMAARHCSNQFPATQAGDRRYPPRAGGHLGRHAAAAGTSQLERVARDGGHPYRDRPDRRDRGDGVGGHAAGARPGQREHVADDGGHPHRDRRRLGRDSREPRQPDQEHHLAQDKRPAHHTGRLAGRGERAS